MRRTGIWFPEPGSHVLLFSLCFFVGLAYGFQNPVLMVYFFVSSALKAWALGQTGSAVRREEFLRARCGEDQETAPIEGTINGCGSKIGIGPKWGWVRNRVTPKWVALVSGNMD